MPNEAITGKLLSNMGKSFHNEVAFYSIFPTTILVSTKLREYRNLHKLKN